MKPSNENCEICDIFLVLHNLQSGKPKYTKLSENALPFRFFWFEGKANSIFRRQFRTIIIFKGSSGYPRI